MGPTTLEAWIEAGRDLLPGLLGLIPLAHEGTVVRLGIDVGPEHLNPLGALHGGTVVALADSACGTGCRLNLPAGVTRFTTVELKTNFLGTATEGRITCEARLVHGGRTTQVWDAEVRRADGRAIALFRCTQLLMYG
ncbi:MAG: PaaI family thioesterase [Thermoleophilia bacterium]